MPTQSKTVNKFQLIDILTTLMNAIEDDQIKSGKITFNLTKTGMYNVTVFFLEK